VTGVQTCALPIFLIRAKKIPLLELDYPANEDEAKEFVFRISEFLKSLKPAEEKR
jgi:hypothetical protein